MAEIVVLSGSGNTSRDLINFRWVIETDCDWCGHESIISCLYLNLHVYT